MPSLIRNYDRFWASFTTDVLKRMATVWGADSKLPKAERVTYLLKVLTDPQRIDEGLARMMPYERAAIHLVKLLGGSTGLGGLGIAVRVTGLPPTTETYMRPSSTDSVGQRLMDRGIVMPVDGSHYLGYSYADKQVFVDDRILARISPPEYKPLALPDAETPPSSTWRRVPNVMLEVIALMRAIDELGGIGLTKTRICA